jgi:hypothetical protein
MSCVFKSRVSCQRTERKISKCDCRHFESDLLYNLVIKSSLEAHYIFRFDVAVPNIVVGEGETVRRCVWPIRCLR